MKKLFILPAIAALTSITLTGCAGLTCNDGYQEGMFGDCTGHGGANLQKSFPGTAVDNVDMVAVSAFNHFQNTSNIKPLDNKKAALTFNKENCVEHVEWVEKKLAAQGIKGDMIVSETEFSYHAAFLTTDGRVIDINHNEPLTLGEWLEFTNRI